MKSYITVEGMMRNHVRNDSSRKPCTIFNVLYEYKIIKKWSEIFTVNVQKVMVGREVSLIILTYRQKDIRYKVSVHSNKFFFN